MNLFSEPQKVAIRSLNPLTDSKFKYNKSSWENLNENYKDEIKDYEDKEISRQDVIDSYKDYFEGRSQSYIKPFLLTMIWGFADLGFGAHRTSNFISVGDGNERIQEALEYIIGGNENSLRNAFNELKKIKGLGISYTSKVLYFATRAKEIHDYALIFDIRVASALIKLTTPKEIYEIVKIAPSSKFKDYEKYNCLIHGIVEEIEASAENIEMYLFNQEFD